MVELLVLGSGIWVGSWELEASGLEVAVLDQRLGSLADEHVVLSCRLESWVDG